MFEGVFNPLIAFVFGGWANVGFCGARQKLADLFQGLDLLNIHDDVHPAIMDEASLIVEH